MRQRDDSMTDCIVAGAKAADLVMDDDAAFAAFAAGMAAYEAAVLAGDNDANQARAAREVWTATPAVGRRNARGWQGWRVASRDAAMRTGAIVAAARAAGVALIGGAAALIAVLVSIAATIDGARVRAQSSHFSGRLRRLPHAALTPRLAARPRGGRVLIAAA